MDFFLAYYKKNSIINRLQEAIPVCALTTVTITIIDSRSLFDEVLTFTTPVRATHPPQ
jgi:hypothetical protein